jgi:capsular exopolysaccharide synthesis family protein
MEIRQYLFLVRKWALLLIAGTIIGSVGTFLYSYQQAEVYQTLARVMVMGSSETRTGSDYVLWSDIQLAKTYSELITTGPVIDALSAKLGYQVFSRQISIKQVTDSVLLDITVKDGDPLRAADIANQLVDEFVIYNNSLQKNRYASSEESLQAQIQQVEGQLNSVQAQMSDLKNENLISQQTQVEEQLATLESQINALKGEIAALNNSGATSTNSITLVGNKQRELELLQTRYTMYQEIYVNLVVLGQPSAGSSANLRQTQLQTTLALYQQIYTNLLNNYEQVRLARLRSTPNVIPVEPAKVPVAPISPQPLRDAGVGGAVGLMLMAALAFAIEYLDDTIKTPEDVNRLLGVPVIGLIGEMEYGKEDHYIYTAENPRSPITEAFRNLRTNLDFAGVDKPIRSLLVTSASPSEGKSTIATNLAVVMAQGDRKVVLIDADMRRPSVHLHLQIPNYKGLSDVFRRPDDLNTILSPWRDFQMRVLTSGSLPPNPAELLGSAKMAEIIKACQQSADIVIIDSPPFVVSDPVILAAKIDGVLLVIEPGGTKIDMARTMLEQLERAGAHVVGVVLNPISRQRAHYYAGRYRYYSEYYSSRSYGYYLNEPKTNGRPNGSRGANGNGGAKKVKTQERAAQPARKASG